MHQNKTLERQAQDRNGIRRAAFAALAILLETISYIFLFTWLNDQSTWLELLTRILAVLLVLGIYSQNRTSSLKMPWIILILAFPMLGVALYLLIGLSGSTNRMRARYAKIDRILLPLLPDNHEAFEALNRKDRDLGNLAYYLKETAGYPVWQNTQIAYFDSAAKGLEAQLCELSKAEHFIFMEYHAIEEKESWAKIQAVLVDRVKHGVEVRIFYDDVGSIGFINTDFVHRMNNLGIQCRVFNPLNPFLQFFFNNRDHRKITVIDGQVGFTGGYNLADEYFNITHPYGHWKDTGVMLTGEAVDALTVTFLEMWNAVSESDKDDVQFWSYFPRKKAGTGSQSFILPYADQPMDNEQTGENVYINLISRAKDYIWFMTPYLIITDEMSHALSLASKRGVDVRIITPGIPDKKMIYNVTRSYYHALTENGVRIFEYTPGFCHAKQCVTDDLAATCGTINLDYRSLYHHFENGCLFASCDAVLDMKRDFEETFGKCTEVTEKYRQGRSAVLRIEQMVLRLFAELL